MKNKSSIVLISIKTNNEIVNALKQSRKINLPYLTIWLSKQSDKSLIQYALLVNKNQFKLAVTRNKIKRQLRNILLSSDWKGGIKVLLKPNSTYLKKEVTLIQKQIILTINKYQNGK